jgi:hypothetical protein
MQQQQQQQQEWWRFRTQGGVRQELSASGITLQGHTCVSSEEAAKTRRSSHQHSATPETDDAVANTPSKHIQYP